MKIHLLNLILLISYISAQSQTPEEVAIKYLTDSIVGEEIFDFNAAKKDTSKIYIQPIIHLDYYKDGLLSDYQLVSEGKSYGKSKSPFLMDIEWYIEGEYEKEFIEKVERTNSAYINQWSEAVILDTIKVKLPPNIENIGIKDFDKKIGQKRVFMRVRRALYTGKEYFVQIDFFREFVNHFDLKDGFIIEVEINKKLEPISWDIRGAY